MNDPTEWWCEFAVTPSAHTLLGYATAFVLGTLIGLERQWRQRTAGLRTNVLVAMGAAAFSDLGFRAFGAEGGIRIIACVGRASAFAAAVGTPSDNHNRRRSGVPTQSLAQRREPR